MNVREKTPKPAATGQKRPNAPAAKPGQKRPPQVAPEGKRVIDYQSDLLRSVESTNKSVKRQTWVIAASLAVAAFFGLTKDYYVYFAAEEDWRLRELQPLNHPLLETSQWLQIAVDGAVAANTYRFNTIQRDMEQARKHFTREGWASFEKAIQRSGNLVRAQKNQQTSQAFVEQGTATIVDEGLDPLGRAFRRIQFPMKVNTYSRSEEQTYSYTVEIVVVRVSEVDFPRGIAINEYRAK